MHIIPTQNPDIAPDFVAGVTHLLVKKEKKTRAPWSPSTLAEVSQQDIRSKFFDLKNSKSLKIPKLSPLPPSTKSYKSYPHQNFALPSEALIEKVVKGELKSSGSLALTRKEVIQWFGNEWSNKIGLSEKLNEVLNRRTKENEDGTVSWRH